MRSLILAALAAASPGARAAQPAVHFDWFEYSSHDENRTIEKPPGVYSNPILPGYYPDPAIERVGDKFYLVNSTFAHWPGIPIHESTDLVNWRLIGYALTDPGKFSFDGLGISRGVFAPSIHHHEGTFYIINTLVDAGGNFFVTAKNPAGPWSDPVWLKEIDGIDPSFFFDAGGKTFILNNGAPEGKPQYEGHRAIWMQEYDLAARKLIGPRRVIVNGGADPSKKPIWIEGPHLYFINGWYYLMCAEGGTGFDHSEVVFRSKSVWGPYAPYEHNPILTQRDLMKVRMVPVTSTGHADLVQRADGSWWSVFLGTRPYAKGLYNTGRETFLLPVKWRDGWPVILPKGEPVPIFLDIRTGMPAPDPLPRFGLADARDNFDNSAPGPEWLQIHVPKQTWFDTTTRKGYLTIRPLEVRLDAMRNASFLARRQQDTQFSAYASLEVPTAAGISAGIAVFQNETHWYFFGLRRDGDQLLPFVERRDGEKSATIRGQAFAPKKSALLIVEGSGGHYSFQYNAGAGAKMVLEDDDATFLSTEKAGGFVGTVLGPYARQD
ncbi:MAG TPA: glycoside hydrolase family 43 protein [Steroidobacteraceae bacterium]|nr:glycoside hydrolase family 43 protein [Steroidobacteraceae bacterium]